jgi:hypothetical protein
MTKKALLLMTDTKLSLNLFLPLRQGTSSGSLGRIARATITKNRTRNLYD